MKNLYLFFVVFLWGPNLASGIPDRQGRNQAFEMRIEQATALRNHLEKFLRRHHEETFCTSQLVGSTVGIDFNFISDYLGEFRWTPMNLALTTMAMFALNAMDFLAIDVGLERNDFPPRAILPVSQAPRKDWDRLLWAYYDLTKSMMPTPIAGRLSRDDVTYLLLNGLRRPLGPSFNRQVDATIDEIFRLPPEPSEIGQRYFALAQVLAIAVDGIGGGWARHGVAPAR